MKVKTVYQADHQGFYVGQVPADESPLEPGVFLLPGGAVETQPPLSWPEDKWPRWNGSKWMLVNKPAAAANDNDPVGKLRAFLTQNPDVLAMLQSNDGGANV